MTKDWITNQITQLEAQQLQIVSQANQIAGAIQAFKVMLAEMELPEEPKVETPPEIPPGALPEVAPVVEG